MNTYALVLSFPSLSTPCPGLNLQLLSLDDATKVLVSCYLDCVLALGWLWDHTIILVSVRKGFKYLECISKGKITQLISLPSHLDQLSIFEVVSADVSTSYAFLSDGKFGYILKIVANFSILTAGNVSRSAPKSYAISLLYTADLGLSHPVLPFKSCKLIISSSVSTDQHNQIALVTVDSNGAGHIYQEGDVRYLGLRFEDVYRLDCHCPEYDGHALFKALHLGDPYYEWNHHIDTPLTFSAFERGNFFGFKEGIILWSLLKSYIHQAQQSDTINTLKYLPSQFLELSKISLPFCIYQRLVADFAIATESAMNTKALSIAYCTSASSALMLDSVELMLKQEVESKAFQHDDASFLRALQLLVSHDPLLLSEVLSSLTRKLEPSVLQRIFPLPPENASQVDLFSISMQCSVLTHASRLLTVASEQIGWHVNAFMI